MPWEHIPNEVVKSFTGKPIQAQVLDANLEDVYKPMKCPGRGPLEPPDVVCDKSFTNLLAYSEHVMGVHGFPANTSVAGQLELEDATVARLLMRFLMQFNNESRDNPLRQIRKANDSFHSQEIWRRAFLALNGKDSAGHQTTEVRLKVDQYRWLHDVLDRKLPIAADARERGEEQQTVGLYLFGGSEESVREAFKTVERRRKKEADESDDAPLSLVK